MNDENNITRAWQLYELGKSYNNRLIPNQYNTVETNTEFFIGNQWLHLPETRAMRNLAKPVFNILKRVASLFIASLTSSGTAVHFEPLAYYDGSNLEDPQHDAAAIVNAEVENLFEKLKMDYRLREALFDGAITGDYCAHFWYDPDALAYGGAFGPYKGEIRMELVDGINVMFGNPNNRNVEDQPYILLVGRDTVRNLAEEAKRFKVNKRAVYDSGKANELNGDMLQQAFAPDAENQYFTGVGGKTELDPTDNDGKALYVILYTKVSKEVDKIGPDGEIEYEEVTDENGVPVFEEDENGRPVLDSYGLRRIKRQPVKVIETSVHVTKATRTAIIYEDVDTGLTRYPIAWGNWERQKNQYHGRALVTGLVPNQIFINSMFATGMRHLQLMAFPKTVYNADLISAWTNEVGQAIGVHGLMPGQNISSVAYNLQPAEMSNQIFNMIDRAVALTKECLGATDAQMGTAKAENTSALMVLQTNSEVPLENQQACKHEWIEDCALILTDMMGTYYGERPIVMDREFEEPIMNPGSSPAIDPTTGQMQTMKIVRRVKELFDFSQLKHIGLNCRVDVGATTYYSEIAMTQTLDNLRRDGTLDVIQYLERIPDKLLPKKQELLDELKGRISEGKQMNAAAGAAIPEPGSPMQGEAPADAVGAASAMAGNIDPEKGQIGLSDRLEQAYNNLPNIAKKTALHQGEIRMR